MNTVLTDEEISLLAREAARGSAINREGGTSLRIGRAIEAAVLAKFGEPVAWMHPSGGVLRKLDTGLEKDTYTIPLYAIKKEEA